uniref:type II secretion system protein M n=1 Tax=Thaumasiovibrio occultus TaxID=1891184 RepID=UPI000B34AF68|nr:type II secretion system protein M [Thaumasiovibrio occultus]
MKQWWSSISEREQRLVLAMAVTLVIGIFYFGAIKPLKDKAASAEQQLQVEQNQTRWLQENVTEIVNRRGTSSAPSGNSNLNQVVNSSASSYRVEVIRMQPRDESLQVWIQPLAFNDLLAWLAFLQENHGITVEFLDLNRDKRGGVVAVSRLQIGR